MSVPFWVAVTMAITLAGAVFLIMTILESREKNSYYSSYEKRRLQLQQLIRSKVELNESVRFFGRKFQWQPSRQTLYAMPHPLVICCIWLSPGSVDNPFHSTLKLGASVFLDGFDTCNVITSATELIEQNQLDSALKRITALMSKGVEDKLREYQFHTEALKTAIGEEHS